MKSILFTQCLQNDFVAPLGPWDPMPCVLHVGSAEASRLAGEIPAEGPLVRFVDWAHALPSETLEIVHIRDLHNPDDPTQTDHLRHFGPHCLKGTRGAEFVFELPDPALRVTSVVSSTTLNDFLGTGMDDLLRSLLPGVERIGIVGAWTDAKVSFLAYELRTRFPHLDVAVCSALAASSSRERHLVALDHLERVIGTKVFHSVGEFCQFLSPGSEDFPRLERRSWVESVRIQSDRELPATDHELLAWLYRDSASIEASSLDGGFSGNVVLGVRSVDLEGCPQVPHVVKIGPRSAIGRERVSFEAIEPILGNSAPRIADFSDLGDRGGIKYRYASMTGGRSRTFQSLWKAGLEQERVDEILRTVFEEQLGRLYHAAAPEQVDLLETWAFESSWTDSVSADVRSLGIGEPDRECEIAPGVPCLPVVPFYRDVVPRHLGRNRELAPFARVHGDLNGANILVDDNRNVWLIDFFHSRRHHVVADFAKLESDIIHIWTPLETEDDLRSFVSVLQALQQVDDLAKSLPPAQDAGIPQSFHRTWNTLRTLRLLLARPVGTFRDPWQYRIASLRYAVHTIGFDEPTLLQRKGALVHAGLLAKNCQEHLEQERRLRVDWIPLEGIAGRLGLTLLPGRADRGRDLGEDLDRLVEYGTNFVVDLVTDEELFQFGVSELPVALGKRGIDSFRLPILDQRACDVKAALDLSESILGRLREGGTVVVHCVGGIGRSGMIAACVCVIAGMSPDQAIAHVRLHRSPRALETRVQIELVREFASSLHRISP